MNKLGAQVTKTAMVREVDRTILEGKCIVYFRAAIKSPYTLDPYERRLCRFLRFMKMTCDQFVRYAKKNPTGTEKKIIEYSIEDKTKLLEKDPEKRIAACTIANRLKPVRLLLEVNDADKLNWKKSKDSFQSSEGLQWTGPRQWRKLEKSTAFATCAERQYCSCFLAPEYGRVQFLRDDSD